MLSQFHLNTHTTSRILKVDVRIVVCVFELDDLSSATRTHFLCIKDFINRTCQCVSVVNAAHILQCARAHNCIWYHWLSVTA